jgi:hypothetical protein
MNLSNIFAQAESGKKEMKEDVEIEAVLRAENHLKLPPINMSIVRKDGIAGQMQVKVLLESKSAEIHEELSYLSPIIMDSILDRLWRVFSVLWITGTIPDHSIIKNHLRISLEKMKYIPKIKNIHIEQIFIAVPRYGPYRHTNIVNER